MLSKMNLKYGWLTGTGLAATAAIVLAASTAQGEPAGKTPAASAASKLASLERSVPALQSQRATDPYTDPAFSSAPIDVNDGLVDETQVHRPAARSNRPVFVAPTKDREGVCIGGPGRLICGASQNLATDGAIVGVSKSADTGYFVSAIVSETVTSVTATFADGRTEPIEARAGVVAAELNEAPVSVSWVGPSGPIEIINPDA